MQDSLFDNRPEAEAITLRGYQRASVEAVYSHLRRRDDNPVVVIPTGGGKTPVIATICGDAVELWGGRVIVLAHVKELLEQNAGKLAAMQPGLDVGVYSAGLGRRDRRHSVIVAGIQSVYQRACELDRFDLAIIDEAHLIPPEGDGMYRQFLADAKVVNPNLRIIGLTATPFRLKSGTICTDDGFLNSICFEVGIKELIADGYLSPLITKAGIAKADTSGLHVRAGEFVADEVESLFNSDPLVEGACEELVAYSQDRQACLIFASGIDHGQHIVSVLNEQHDIECGFVTGETPPSERDRLIDRFRNGDLKYLANVNVLTTGFDAPHIDCIALLRPTMSPGLYYQMVGRGFRLSPGKHDCLVLDFGSNVLRHGPVDCLKIKNTKSGASGDAPAKECPQCQALIAAGYAVCPQCGFGFPEPERSKHDTEASDEGILSGQVTIELLPVSHVVYSEHTKRGALPDDPKTLRVDYLQSLKDDKSEWICFEHDGWAQQKAAAWWKARSREPVPKTVAEAYKIARHGGLAEPTEITVRKVTGEKFDRIVDYKLGEIPEPVPAEERGEAFEGGSVSGGDAIWPETDDIPF